jgi:hypothetical protein
MIISIYFVKLFLCFFFLFVWLLKQFSLTHAALFGSVVIFQPNNSVAAPPSPFQLQPVTCCLPLPYRQFKSTIHHHHWSTPWTIHHSPISNHKPVLISIHKPPPSLLQTCKLHHFHQFFIISSPIYSAQPWAINIPNQQTRIHHNRPQTHGSSTPNQHISSQRISQSSSRTQTVSPLLTESPSQSTHGLPSFN